MNYEEQKWAVAYVELCLGILGACIAPLIACQGGMAAPAIDLCCRPG